MSQHALMPRLVRSELCAGGMRAQCLGMMTFTNLPSGSGASWLLLRRVVAGQRPENGFDLIVARAVEAFL